MGKIGKTNENFQFRLEPVSKRFKDLRLNDRIYAIEEPHPTSNVSLMVSEYTVIGLRANDYKMSIETDGSEKKIIIPKLHMGKTTHGLISVCRGAAYKSLVEICNERIKLMQKTINTYS